MERLMRVVLLVGVIGISIVGCATTRKARVFNLDISTGSQSISRQIVPDTLSESERQNFTIWDLNVSLIVPGGIEKSKKITETDSTMGMEIIHGKGGLIIEIAVERGNMIYMGPLICYRAIDYIAMQKKRYGCVILSDSLKVKQPIACYSSHPKFGGMAIAAFVCELAPEKNKEVVAVVAAYGTFLDNQNNPAQLFITIRVPKERFFLGDDRMVMGILESLQIEGARPFTAG